jgi:hypothetical protein
VAACITYHITSIACEFIWTTNVALAYRRSPHSVRPVAVIRGDHGVDVKLRELSSVPLHLTDMI